MKDLGRPRSRSKEEEPADAHDLSGELPPDVMKMINQDLYLYEQQLRAGGAPDDVEVVHIAIPLGSSESCLTGLYRMPTGRLCLAGCILPRISVKSNVVGEDAAFCSDATH